MIRVMLIILIFSISLQAKEADVCRGKVVLEKIGMVTDARNKSITYYTAYFTVKEDLSKNFRGKRKISVSWTENSQYSLPGRYKYMDIRDFVGKELIWSFKKKGSKFYQNGYPNDFQ